MEDIKAYIESGILELYILGDVSLGEKLQVEEMAAKHPAIRAELDAIERAMELYAQKNGVEPPEHLRSRVLNSMLTNLADDSIFPKKPVKTHDPGDTDNTDSDNTFAKKTVKTQNTDIIALSAAKANNFYKYAFAACLALLVASSIALVSMYNRLQESNTQLAALQLDKQHFAARVNLMDKQLQVFRDASFKFLKLRGTAKAPAGANITIAWSPAKKKVMIDMGTMKMPVNDKAHQYQLWALVKGKPVNLGVFDKNPDSTGMKEMRSTAVADAFAVTLEPRGGSASPTMDKMMVIGNF